MYTIVFHEDVDKDLSGLGHSTTILVFKKLKKIAQNPMTGHELGNKANYNLAGFRKVYLDNKRIRIVYKIIEDRIEILVIAIGKRDDMEVYQKASKRI